MMIEHEPQLLALVMAWIEARPFGRPPSSDVTEIPATLQASITTREPYRSQAMADACLFLTLPKPIGVGLTARLIEPVVIVPSSPWPLAIQPLHVRLRWSEMMSGDFSDDADEQLALVAQEQGRWVIVQFYDAALRQQYREQLRVFRQISGLLGPT